MTGSSQTKYRRMQVLIHERKWKDLMYRYLGRKIMNGRQERYGIVDSAERNGYTVRMEAVYVWVPKEGV